MYNINTKEEKFMNKKVLICVGIIVLIVLAGILIIKRVNKDTEKEENNFNKIANNVQKEENEQ